MPQFETNRLINETSPYLLQHSHNPVEWYPWGEEAFQNAESENKPIFLSVGYSACHWCHVMERESFEDHAIAAIMNENFINIKVDREERPDIDDIYMSFVQLTSGSGGWPMSVFLTPDRKPFFGGTYFPPRDAHGRPGFPSILLAVADAWKNDREKVVQSADSVSQRLSQFFTMTTEPAPFREEIFERAAKELLDRFDPIDGGFGGAPKFPPSFGLSMLMRYYAQTGNSRDLKAVTFTLDKMARGGIFDQIGGGLHRYSVDSQWLVPHFEKMLYDNALMAVVYFEAYQLTQGSLYLETARGILDFVLREMTDENGGFHSSLDADSEGKEGEFYVWTPEQIIEILGSHDGKLFCDFYDVTNAGNFEHGKSILHVRVAPEDFAANYKISVGELNNRLAGMRNKLLQAREKRHRPGKDDKVLTDWNSLMISAMARGYQITRDAKYLHAAKRSAEFVLSTMCKDQKLNRVYRRGVIKGNGFLSDYSYFINALLDLFESDFDPEWLRNANALAQKMIGLFSDSENGGFYMTLSDQADVLVRQRDNYDNATPSGSSMAILALLRLARLSENKTLFDIAEKAVASLVGHVERTPAAYLNLLNVCEYMIHPAAEIVLVGHNSNLEFQKMLNLVQEHYIPNRLLISYDPNSPKQEELKSLVPFLKTLPRVDGASAFVCENYACKLPVKTAEDLAGELASKMKPN